MDISTMKTVTNRLSGLFLTIILVVVNAVLIEVILDRFGVEGHRLFTGITGLFLMIISFGYSMRKRKKLITFGNPKNWLTGHERLAIAGTFVIFVHTGTHFNALTPIVTFLFMFIAFVSGLVGRYVYNNAKAELNTKKAELKKRGLSASEIDNELWYLTIASDALSKWRKIHMPVISFLCVLIVYHAFSALYYSGF